ncbi:F0F1 ATP synthase subunit A [Nonomuraea endophytica]|uniref:F0F1 ATP synthase subunit A n=1 Tax=Nonomuraea endophytica TaxID=714136 RepID=UPI0037C57E16
MVTIDDYRAPGPDIFVFPPIIDGGPYWFTKPVLLAVACAGLVIAFCWAAFAQPKIVPRGIQNAGEYVYLFVREQIARPFLGADTDRWMGLLFTQFLLILTWNLVGLVPFVQFPASSYIAFPGVLAVATLILKVHLGVKHQGFTGYFKNMSVPPGLPRWALGIYAPMELAHQFLFSWATHAIRVCANMFAGHMLLAFFSSVGFWFLVEKLSPLGAPIGLLGVVMTILLTAFELFIMFLQAYLFTMLSAMYIAGGLRAEH